MTPQIINEIFARFKKNNPTPKGELHYTNSYTLLVAVVLSAQATDKGVNKATEKLFTLVETPQEMVDLGEEGLKEHVKTIGLYNTKAKNIIKLSEILVEQYQGQVPESLEQLKSLPGVGQKTANVVLNIAFGQPTIAIDTHVFRVSNRTGIAQGKTPAMVEEKLNKVVPVVFRHDAPLWLILHGRYVCKAQKPLCAQCPINDLCEFPEKNL